MRSITPSSPVRALLLATLAAPAITASAMAVDVTCPATPLWLALPRSLPLNPWDLDGQGQPLPALGQGQNGITCESRDTATGATTPLTWLNYAGAYWCWGDPNLAFNVPQIYAMENGHGIWAHPNLGLQAVVRVTLEGPASGVPHITGATTTTGSSTITFTICKNTFDQPIWTGGPFTTIDATTTFAAGDQILFITDAGKNPVKDWAQWVDLRISPAKPIDLTADGAVNAADLALLLGAWGSCGDCAADYDCSGTIDAADLSILLGAWGG